MNGMPPDIHTVIPGRKAAKIFQKFRKSPKKTTHKSALRIFSPFGESGYLWHSAYPYAFVQIRGVRQWLNQIGGIRCNSILNPSVFVANPVMREYCEKCPGSNRWRQKSPRIQRASAGR
ncbi:MAG: hypothetical protein LBF51_02710 [Zoogloeaceae bacterium]|nr:hypothetical protein [Zoogloeaceae bacterium]